MDPLTFPTPDGLELDIRVPAGNIELRATDTAETRVEITGERHPEDVFVQIVPGTRRGQRLVIEHKPGRGHGWFGGSDNMRAVIVLPLGADVEASGGSTDLRATGALGSLNLRTGSGDLAFEEIRGSAVVKVASGDVTGSTIGADLRVQSASGDVQVGRVSGTTHVTTASGDIRIDQADGSVQATTVSGDLTIGTAMAGEIHLRTISGDIEIGVAPGTRVWLDLGSRTGNTVSDLEPAGGGEGSRLEIRASSVSGDIHVARSDAAVAV